MYTKCLSEALTARAGDGRESPLMYTILEAEQRDMVAGDGRESPLMYTVFDFAYCSHALGMAGNHRSCTLETAAQARNGLLGMAGNHRSCTLRQP